MALGWSLLVLGLGVVTGIHLDPDDLAYVKKVVSRSHIEIQATDGVVYIRTVTADVPGPLKCSMSRDRDSIAKVLGDKDVVIEAIGEAAIRFMKNRCAEIHQLPKRPLTRRSSSSYFPFPPEKTGLPQGPGNSLLIMPGTKWCGESNVASNYEDLGVNRETDACCRAHDQCPYFIGPLQTKYNHRNSFPWTLSHCDCDAAFFNCLKGIKSLAAYEAGKGFFGLLDVNCFVFKTTEYCTEYHWSQLWCQQNATGPAAVVQKLGLHW